MAFVIGKFIFSGDFLKQIDVLTLQNKLLNSACLVGLRQVVRHLEKSGRHLGCVVVADDAEQRIKSLVIELCNKHNVELLSFPSKEQLGALAGIKVNCAVLGLL